MNYCDICKVEIKSIKSYRRHLKSKKHEQYLNMIDKDNDYEDVKEEEEYEDAVIEKDDDEEKAVELFRQLYCLLK